MCKKIKEFFTLGWSSEVLILLSIAGFLALLILPFDYVYNIGRRDLLLNANGLILTLFIYGSILTIYNNFKRNNELKTIYHEEIDDYRDWKAEEAKFRILGNIKRLFKLGEKSFDFNRCYLQQAYLRERVFYQSDFNHIDLSCSILESCVFEKVNFSGANLAKTNIMRCKFIECKINSANFFDTILYEVDFDKSDLKSFCESNNLHKCRAIYNPKNLDADLLAKIQKENPAIARRNLII